MSETPSWLQRPLAALPSWAKVVSTYATENKKVSVCIEADTDGYVREWLELLGVDKPDQYWLEVCYQCAKLDLQNAISNTEHDPRTCGMSAEFHFTKAEKWAQKKHPVGRGAKAATAGREAREHYKRVRGFLPF